MNRNAIWALRVVAKPFSSPQSLPSFDPAYWKCVVSRPQCPRGIENYPDPYRLVGSPSTLTLTRYIDQGNTCAAFRGTWYGAPVVVKYIQSEYSARFVSEAQVYLSGIAHLRGKVIPQFFGLYRTDFFALLVVEDCGNAISQWHDLDLQERCAKCFFFLPL
jgi:hypothetical protein